MNRILIIDDDLELCDLLTKYLEPEGFKVESAHGGRTGLEYALREAFDLIVLDVMLPEMSGFDVLHQIRRESTTPILMLTARGDHVDRIVGLEMGADDYLPKPFNSRELAARIRAILRRARQPSEVATTDVLCRPVAVGDVELDPGTRVVRRDRERIDLTALEFNLLEILLREAGSVVAREKLVKLVLSRDPTPYDRSIDVHMSNLRKKLGNQYDGTERIKTVRGVGYIYTLPVQEIGAKDE
ncbi:response regulator transcription factor [Desulfoferrobacter suflitae]|uniref:response regulator transcription factor n=1 Tax=Desulfoferrobacter suflitae TaxID=2865782 RepID=UPI002164A432|nr:response regulator transcription factor [Desulfoferrobacter suflitae]MCK8600126.1 response regulator transcription factor [Desulfoferrobacter suflitae]